MSADVNTIRIFAQAIVQICDSNLALSKQVYEDAKTIDALMVEIDRLKKDVAWAKEVVGVD